MSAPQPCVTTQVPGPQGPAGTNGVNGTNGLDSFSTINGGGYLVPAYGASVTVPLTDPPGSRWMSPDQIVFVNGYGYYRIVSLPDATHAILFNLGDGVNYPGNVNGNGALSFASGTLISPGGLQGPSGALTGAASGDLTGNYPGPTLKLLGPGAVTVGDSGNVAQVTTDANGRVTALTAVAIAFPGSAIPSGGASGDLVGTYPGPTLAASGVTAAVYGSEVLVPQLTIDAKGRATVAVNRQPRYGMLGSLTSVNLNAAGDTAIPINSSRFVVRRIIVENASVSLTTATASVLSGVNILAANQALSALTATSKWLDLTLSGTALTDVQTGPLTFRVGTPQGVAAVANVWVEGEHLG